MGKKGGNKKRNSVKRTSIVQGPLKEDNDSEVGSSPALATATEDSISPKESVESKADIVGSADVQKGEKTDYRTIDEKVIGKSDEADTTAATATASATKSEEIKSELRPVKKSIEAPATTSKASTSDSTGERNQTSSNCACVVQ